MVEAINAMPTQRSKARVWNIHAVFPPPTPPASRPAQRPHGRWFTRGRPRWPGTTLLSQQAVERRCEVTMTAMVNGDGDVTRVQGMLLCPRLITMPCPLLQPASRPQTMSASKCTAHGNVQTAGNGRFDRNILPTAR